MRRVQPSHTMAAPFLLIVLATLIAGLIVPGDGEQNVQRCVSFVLQRPGANCNCDSTGETCTCIVNGRSPTAHPCRLALALSTSRRSRPTPSRISQVNAISGRQADENLRPIDLRPQHPFLGTLDGDEEPFYHMSILPQNIDELNTRFFIYVSFLPNDQSELNYNDNSTIEKIFNFAFEKVFVIAHDQNEARVTQDELYIELKNRLLAIQRSSAVILVDWTVAAEAQTIGGFFDDQAAANTIVVGREVALICYLLANRAIIADEDFYFIGNGLGAQMLHFAARYYTQLWRNFGFNNGNPVGLDGPQRKVGRFTAFDPTAKHFQGFLSNTLAVPHVNRWDATSVDVIHTSCVRGPRSGFDDEDIEGERIGMTVPTGKIDFYPNGCPVNHPNCAGNPPGRLQFRCNHQMALYFFIASISRDPTVENYMNAFPVLFWDNRENMKKLFEDSGFPRNIMGFKARSDNSLANLGHFSLPLVLDLDTYSIDQERTDAVMFEVDFFIFGTQRVVHPKYRPPGIDSGQSIIDFPPQKPQGLISLDEKELPSCGQFRPPVRSVPSARVVEGHLPFVNQFPWVVCLISLIFNFNIPGQSQWRNICTGSLLNSRFAVFAAHCFNKPRPLVPDPNQPYTGQQEDSWVYYVTFGTNDCMQPTNGNYRRVVLNNDFLFIYEDYNPLLVPSSWDISLVKFHDPIELPFTYNGGSVNSICWRSAPQFNYENTATNLYIAGFGRKSINDSLDNSRLTWIDYRTVQPDYTSYSGGFADKIMNEAWPGTWNMKTIERNTLRTTGPGDSGSAIVWYVRTAEDNEVDPSSNVSIYRGVVAGVVIANTAFVDNPEVDQDGRSATPLIGTKTGMPVFQWIEKIVNGYIFLLDEEPVEHLQFKDYPNPVFVT